MSIQSRIPVDEYAAIDALNISRLKEMERSAQHYQYRLEHPKESKPMTLGIATHVAVLEPERFSRQFAIWNRRTDAGKMAPRNGKYWDEFRAHNDGKTIITEDEATEALTIADAVRSNRAAMKYLDSGEPEVTMQWHMHNRKCKARVDWLTMAGDVYLVGLKTARDCRPFMFGAQAAKLGYHLQMAWYYDGYKTLKNYEPDMVEIVVENTPPYAVAVYRIPKDVIDLGREKYEELLVALKICEDRNVWPGPVDGEDWLSLPTWAFGSSEDDLGDLGLVA